MNNITPDNKSQTEKLKAKLPHEKHAESQHTAHKHAGHDHDEDDSSLDLTNAPEDEDTWLSHWPLLTALLILVVMLVFEYGFRWQPQFPLNLAIFTVAFILSGYNVLGMAWRKAKHLDFFNEFF